MNTKYIIQWKSKVNGRAGRGTKVFELDEAQQLAQELNQEYPEIDHEVAESAGHLGERANQPAELNQEDQSRTPAEKPAGEPASIFSFQE
jgi:hypothetical protein